MRNRKPNRMKGYDYSRDNLYFVTICVDKMRCCLGDIVECNDNINENLNSKVASNSNLNQDSERVGTARELSVQQKDAYGNIQNDIDLDNPNIESLAKVNEDSDWVGTARELSVRRKIPNNPIPINTNSISSNQKSSHQIMQLNTYGKIVLMRLQWLAEQYKYVVIHSHIVMPNHVHAIIGIDSLLIPDVGIKIKSVSELIGAFKSTSSKMIHDDQFLEFKWKRSFHDHIIRDEQSFHNISNYIINNPLNWKLDNLNPNRLGA